MIAIQVLMELLCDCPFQGLGIILYELGIYAQFYSGIYLHILLCGQPHPDFDI